MTSLRSAPLRERRSPNLFARYAPSHRSPSKPPDSPGPRTPPANHVPSPEGEGAGWGDEPSTPLPNAEPSQPRSPQDDLPPVGPSEGETHPQSLRQIRTISPASIKAPLPPGPRTPPVHHVPSPEGEGAGWGDEQSNPPRTSDNIRCGEQRAEIQIRERRYSAIPDTGRRSTGTLSAPLPLRNFAPRSDQAPGLQCPS
jgi:hypothetical protein